MADTTGESDASRTRTPAQVALDLMLYAPVGLVLSLTEELPRLAAKGRSRLETRLNIARVVGEFTVIQGRRELDRLVDRLTAGTDGTAPATGEAGDDPPTGAPVPSPPASPTDSTFPADPGGPSPRRGRSRARADPDGDALPTAAMLAIPGYDSLSASQVVQRLAGLSATELESARAYESASRNRRTILTRISQLQGS